MSYAGLGTTIEQRPATLAAGARCLTIPPPSDCWTCEPGMSVTAAAPGARVMCSTSFAPQPARPPQLTPVRLSQFQQTPESLEAAIQAGRSAALRRNVIGGAALLLGAVAGGAAGRRLAPKNQIVGMAVGGVAGAAASFGALAFYALMNMGHG